MPVSPRPDLDVLIPTRDRPNALAVTLSGLLAQQVSGRLVVADQTPGTPADQCPAVASLLAVLRLRGWDVTVHHRPHVQRGVAEQRQFLLDQVRCPYVLMLDDDVLLEHWVVARLLAAIDELGCGFVGMALAAASYLDDVRPAELQHLELWEGPVVPERVRKGEPAWERWRLHNAANVAHLADRVPAEVYGRRGWVAYKVAWVPGCVLFRSASLRAAGGFQFWRDLPANLRGEDVTTQLRIMQRDGGAGLLPSGAWHLELPTTVADREVDVYAEVLEREADPV